MSVLKKLIQKRSHGDFATAIPAIPATHDGEIVGTVARIATIAIANPKEHELKPVPVPIQTLPGNHWEITLSDGRVIEVAISPPETREQVIEAWQAVKAEMLPDIPQIKEPDRGSLHGA
ncbi:MAG: hypothetical protein G3I09_03055 [Ferrovum sp.]|nr:hypothetical protein [Ferrovum sp.]